MPWIISFHPAVRKDLRRLPREAVDFILNDVASSLAENPYCGDMLHGPLRGVWKLRSGEYRVAYCIDEKHHEIIILEIGSRGGFYERLCKRLKK